MSKNFDTLKKHNVKIGDHVDIVTLDGRYTVKVLSITPTGNVLGLDSRRTIWFEAMYIIYNNTLHEESNVKSFAELIPYTTFFVDDYPEFGWWIKRPKGDNPYNPNLKYNAVRLTLLGNTTDYMWFNSDQTVLPN